MTAGAAAPAAGAARAPGRRRAAAAAGAIVEIRDLQRRVRVDRRDLARLGAWALAALGLGGAEVGVLLVGERRMRTLNLRWRGLDRTTDVLAFPQREGGAVPPGNRALGDVVIAPLVADRQARAAGQSVAAEMEMLLVHGLLHLAGYEHEGDPAGGRRMRRRAEAILGGFRRGRRGRRGRA